VRIAGGLVVTPAGVRRADVVLAGERIASLGPRADRGGETIDAEGCYVLPGGVDPHTHILADVASATRSAAFGGTTTALSFSNPQPGESNVAAVIRGRRQVEGHSAIDVALHSMIGHPDGLTTEDLERIRRLGVRGIKVFLAYPELGLMASDGTLYRILREAARLGLLVQVHCENGGLIQALIDEYLARGKRQTPYFAHSRPPDVEEEAVARTLAIAQLAGAPVYLTHMTTAGGVQLVRAGRANGQTAHAEVCLHHLLLDASRYRGKHAARFLVAPPLRSPVHREALWSAVARGTVDTIGSDHAQSLYQPQPANTGDFRSIPYGFPGIELRLPLLLSEGLRRRIPIQRLAELAATRPAQLFGVFPRKGVIRPGADADLVVWDPRPEWRVKAAALHDGLGDTPYAGMRVRGAIRFVFLRGTLLVANGELVGPDSPGRYLETGLINPRSSRRRS
jgi:dihydropyrimidinase